MLYGIYQSGGAFFAGSPTINDDGFWAVAQNYIITGNVNPGRQEVQADKDDLAKRLDQGDEFGATIREIEVDGTRFTVSKAQ